MSRRTGGVVMGVDSGRRLRSDVSGLIGGFLIIASLYFAREVLIPLCLAGLVTFLLAPVATQLERWKLPRTLAGILVIGLTALGVCSVGWIVLGQVYNLALELPQYQNNITQKVDALHLHSASQLTSTVQMLSEISHQVDGNPDTTRAPSTAELTGRKARHPPAATGQANAEPLLSPPVNVRIVEPKTSWASMAVSDIHPLIAPATSAFAVIIFVLFMLLARDDIRDRTVRLMGGHRIHVTTVAMTDAATRVSRYLLMQFVVNLGYGLLVGTALWAIGVPHPLLWAVTTFLFRFVPYIGILAAGAGPVFFALAASPHWSAASWTLGLYVALELLAANAVEPYLYGSSTGVSALAILVAAVFWTWLWGLPGLLLSTPLTVCLIVVGQHVPRLEFLGVLFGEKTVLDPPQRLYQRILASDLKDARKLVQEEVGTSSRGSVYDRVIVPTLSLVEAARHTDQLDSERAEAALQQLEDLVEEEWTASDVEPANDVSPIVCVAVKDLADDIACQLLRQVLSGTHTVQVLASDLPSADVVDTIARVQPAVVCIVGIPPQAIRHIRVRCRQLRTRFPEITIVACVLSNECDLANVRSRIPMSDANHVACSLEQAQVYLSSLVSTPAGLPDRGDSPTPTGRGSRDSPLDESCEDVFEQIAKAVARIFEAPIALVNIVGEDNEEWRAQCGLSDSEGGATSSLRHSSVCAEAIGKNGLIVADTTLNARFNEDPILLENGIRFFAGMPIHGSETEAIGSLCVFDTRPRIITPRQEDCLKEMAQSAGSAIALRLR